jgi:hypothetical protein
MAWHISFFQISLCKFSKPWYINLGKILMSKFLLNLFVQISKALVYSKFYFLLEKEFSSDFGPSSPAPPDLARYAPQTAGSSLGPSRVGIFAERSILFDFAHSGRDAFSLSCHCHVGHACELLSPSPRWPTVAASPHRF